MSLYSTSYTQGTMVIVRLATVNQTGQQTAPDNFQTPTVSIYYETPSGPVLIEQNLMMTAINNYLFFFTLNSATLAVGSYTAQTTWIFQGQPITTSQRFDVLAFDGQVLLPLDPISRLRIALADMDANPLNWRWKDQDLSEFLNRALENFNAQPPAVKYEWFNIPTYYLDAILMYAEGLALQSKSIQIAANPISYSDKQMSVNFPAQSQMYFNMSRDLMKMANDKALLYKRQISYVGYQVKPGIAALSAPPLRFWNRGWF